MGRLITVEGKCHCGLVRWEADVAAVAEVHECNCSMCSMMGYLHLIVPASQFRLMSSPDDLTTYTFNTGTAKHRFCKVCGIESFYVPRSNPDGFSLNLRCMDRSAFESIEIIPLDGKNWEANAAALAHLSKPSA